MLTESRTDRLLNSDTHRLSDSNSETLTKLRRKKPEGARLTQLPPYFVIGALQACEGTIALSFNQGRSTRF